MKINRNSKAKFMAGFCQALTPRPCVADEEKSLVLEKAEEESDFGLHILDSQPAYITRVDPGRWR